MNKRILYEVPEKREQCVKHFQMADKGMVAAVYPSPVHYKEDGQWKNIDNRLEEVEIDGKKVYQNRASAVKVSFAEEAGAGALVTVEKEGMCLSWEMELRDTEESTHSVDENVRNRTGEIRKRSFRIPSKALASEENFEGHNVKEILTEKEFRKKTRIENWSSEGFYDEILPGVDLQYVIQGERIKENIHLNTKEAAMQPLVFNFKHPGMVMRKEEDGGIGLYRKEDIRTQKEERVFHLVKPYMYDAEGKCSSKVELEADCMEGCSRVVIRPDKEWLQEEERAYPVVIDPMTETSKTKANIEDTYVFSGGTDTSEDPSKVYSYGSFVIGVNNLMGRARALLKFRNLPDIGKGSIIYAATMYVWQYQYSTFGTATFPIQAHEILEDWQEENVVWSNQPAFSGATLDYKEVGQVQNGSTVTITPIGFDVTKLVRQWYNTGINYGIALRSMYEWEADLSKFSIARFYSSDHPQMSSDQFPSGMFYYRNVNGLEDHQSYHEQSAGRAGSGYTNDYTGNVVWIHPDAQTTGGPMRAGIRHVYNSSEAATSSRLGYGWRLSCQQQLVATGIVDYPYVYTDEDGTKHYFYTDSEDGNKLKDEDGLGLVITATTGEDYDHAMTMETKDQIKYSFGGDGYLRFIEDLDGNKNTYAYSPNTSQNYIHCIQDSTGKSLHFEYTTDETLSKLMKIRDEAGRTIHYDYDTQGNLVSITYPDGKKTSFSYDSSHKLLSVTAPDGYCFNYTYTEDFRVPRVSRITEKGTDGSVGQEMLITYSNGNTTVFEEPGLDGEITGTGDNKKTTYHFDNMGRPVDVIDSDGAANNYSYYTEGIRNHKLSKEGRMQKTVYGLLKNHLFDPAYGESGWYTLRISDGTKGVLNRAEGYAGTKSAVLEKTSASTEEGICQDVELTAGTYTLSAYIKTTGMDTEEVFGAGACLAVLKKDGSRIVGEGITYNTDTQLEEGWERLVLTFSLTETENVTVFAGILGMTGKIYVSGVQLEEGSAANKLNLILNSGFEQHTEEVPDCWEFKADITGNKSLVTEAKGRCAAIKGKFDKELYCCQTVNISGKEGDIYQLSCWVTTLGIPKKRLALSAEVISESGTTEWYHFEGNPTISGWQLMSGVFRTESAYKAIKIYINFDYQVNESYYDGVQLIREDGGSYTYDDEGNMVSAVRAAESSHFVYNKNGSLSRMGSIDGTAFEYGYDTKNHLKRAANSEGVRYTFDYDEKGQPVAMKAEGGKHLGAVTPGRVYYIREKYSGNYLTVKDGTSTNGTPILLNLYDGQNAQKWKIVDCKDGYVRLDSQHASGACLDLKDASDADGAAIQLYVSNDTDAQRWKLHPKQDGSYQISCKGTKDKKGLSNTAKSTASGQAVVSYTLAEENTYQDWYFEPADEGTISSAPEAGKVVYIRARHSGQCIDVYEKKKEAGASAVQHYMNGGNNQQFRLLPADTGYYYIEPLHASGMVLAKHGQNDRGFECLALEVKKEGAENQQFSFAEVEPGKGTGYEIVCKESNASMDVMDGSYEKATDIIFTGRVGAPVNKWWILEECSDRIKSSMTYTSDNRQVASVTDARGNTVQYTYDANNRLLTGVQDAKGNVTSYAYDGNTDYLTEVKKSVDGEDVRVQYTYENDRIKSIAHNGFSYNFAYDNYGNRKSVSIGETTLIQTLYRNKNGLTDRVTYATGEAIRNEYNSEEQLSSQYLVKTDGTEEKLYTNTYDNYGNVVKHEDHRNNVVTDCQFDMIGRTVGIDTTDGLRLRTQYDDKNRVQALTQKVDDSLLKTEYIYGDAEKQQKPGLFYGLKVNGTQRVAYTYDRLARLTKKKLHMENGTYETTYNFLTGAEEGTTTTLLSSMKNGTNTLAYTYDEVGNIQTISENGVLKCTYYYDELNQLIREDNVWENKTICYTYDLGGNMTSWKEYAYTTETVSAETTPTKQVSYIYGNTAWKDQLTSYNGQAVTYDALGNPLSYRGMAITWEKGRELKQLVKDGSTISFVYDTAGTRIGKTAGGVTTKYYWNGDQIIALKKGGELLQFVYDEKGILVSMKLNGETYYYLYNAQNDVIGLIDNVGNQVVSYSYNSWGRPLSVTDISEDQVGSKNPFRYRGYCWDEETGLYYVASRYYDPEVGRFISADTTKILTANETSIMQKNLYAYCNNNPVNMVDETGEIPVALVAYAVVDFAVNVAASYAAAKATGQKYTIGDVVACGVSAAASAFIGYKVPIAIVAAGICAGVDFVTAYVAGLYNGESKEDSIVNASVSAVCSFASMGTVLDCVIPDPDSFTKKVITAVNVPYSTGSNFTSAAVSKGLTSNSGKSTVATKKTIITKKKVTKSKQNYVKTKIRFNTRKWFKKEEM